MADEACMSPSWTEARLQSSPRVSVIPCYRSWVGWPAQHSTELPDTQRQFCVEMILVADVRAECGSFLPQSVVLISLLYTAHNEATTPHSGTGHCGHWLSEGPFAGQLLLSSPPSACIHPDWDYGLQIIISKLSTSFESSVWLSIYFHLVWAGRNSRLSRVLALSWIKQKRPESLYKRTASLDHQIVRVRSLFSSTPPHHPARPVTSPQENQLLVNYEEASSFKRYFFLE